MVFFDLPSTTSEDLRAYRAFRKFLLRSGFCMVQESVYSKLALNATASHAVEEQLRKHKPPAGLVQMMTITEKQYNAMEFIIGEKHGELLDSTERLVIV